MGKTRNNKKGYIINNKMALKLINELDIKGKQPKNFYKTKRNESGTMPNSFTSNLIFNFV